jgi:toluene monooxygenase system protein E
MPTEYELVTSELLYYPGKGGFEVRTPLAAWYAQHQRASALACGDWESFVDPRETTYTKYIRTQRAQEAHVDALFEQIERSARPPVECVSFLERTIPVLRYPVHGLMMIAAYVGQMAPAGRIVVAAALQAADEMRRVQRLAQRMALFGPDFGKSAKTTWEKAPQWQPLRELIERALVAWDWGEALVALNLCIKPLFDPLFTLRLGEVAAARGDHLLGPILASLAKDCDWHASWARALCDTAVRARPDNQAVIDAWVARWSPRVARAASALAPVFEASPRAAETVSAQ